jgi:hypothetical protein
MDVKLLYPVWKDFLDTVITVVLVGYLKQLIIFLFDIQKTSPNMIGLTVKYIIIKKQLNHFFKVPGVLFCTIFDCLNAIGWLTDVPP